MLLSRILLAAGVLALPTTAVHAFPPHQWSRSVGDPQHVWITTAAFDNDGNLFVTGDFGGTLQADDDLLVSSGGTDVFVMSFDASGAVRWARSFGNGTTGQLPRALAVDPFGDVIVTGVLRGSVDFGGGVLTSAGQEDIFLVKLGNDGAHLWSKRFGDSAEQLVWNVAVDAAGSVVITGDMSGVFSFGGGTLGGCTHWSDPPDYHCLEAQDIFLARFDKDGGHLSSREFDARDFQSGRELAFDPLGNLILAGIYTGAPDLGGGPLPETEYTWNVFLAKFSSSGEHVWSRGFHSADQGHVMALEADQEGNPVMAGLFFGSVSFGGATFYNGSSHYYDSFVAAFDTEGRHRWSYKIGGPGQDPVEEIAIDHTGSVYLAGHYFNTLTIGDEVLPFSGFSAPFMVSFNGSGDHVESTTYPPLTAGSAFATAIAIDDADRIALVGTFQSSINFGGGTLQNNAQPGFTQDVFVAEFGSPVPVLITGFDARARANAVDVNWSLWSDEAMDGFSLYRREPSDLTSIEIARGAVNGTTGSYRDRDVQPGTIYRYELVVRSADGTEIRSQPATVSMPALHTALGANTPNPFRQTTTIEYTLGERREASIAIYDVRGARVTVLNDGVRDPGTYRIAWNGRDDSGRVVGSGVYFYRFVGDRTIEARKMIRLE